MHPDIQFDLLKSRAAELRRDAAIYRLARAAAADPVPDGRPHRRVWGRLLRRLLAT